MHSALARFRADAAAARADETGTALLPGLRLAGNYTKLSPGEFILSTPAAPAPLRVAPVVDQTFAFRLGVQQPLFTGFRLTGLADAAEAQSQASALELADEFGGSGPDRVIRLLDAVSGGTARHRWPERMSAASPSYRADVGRLMEAGLATRNDLLKIEVQLAGARLAQIDAENERQLAAMTLNNAMGEPLDLPVTPISDPLVTAPDTLLALAMAGNDSTLAELAAGERADLIAARVDDRGGPRRRHGGPGLLVAADRSDRQLLL